MATPRAMLLVAATLLLFSSRVRAATAPEAPNDPWALYDSAFGQAAAGHDADALVLFKRVVHDFPDSAAAPYASEMIRLLDARRTGLVTSPDARTRLLTHGLTPPVSMVASTVPTDLGTRLRAEGPTSLARAELVVMQTFNGIALGFETAQIAKVTDTKPVVLLAMVGGGGGLALSLLLTQNGITPGHALAINSGTLWGAWNGLLGMGLANNLSGQQSAALVAVTQLGGLAVGQGAWLLLHPSAGDVSLVNSGGIWATVISALLANASTNNLSSTTMQTTMLIASDAGLVLGGVLAHEFPMSRGRTLVIDAGGILGTLSGLGVSLLVGMSPGEHQTTFYSLGAVGAVAGLTTSALLSRHWDDLDAPPVRLSVLPTVGGGRALAIAWDF